MTMTLDAADAFLRIGAAGGCGALIGIEREARNQLAGMRTHALVAAGAAIFTLAGAHGFPQLHRGPNVDPMRVAAQIASGIGFIGAGAIIRDRGSVRGITTAAALWTSAAIGLATGAGLWWVTAAGAVLTLFVLIGLRPVSARIVAPLTMPLRTVDIDYEKGHGTLGPVMTAIRETGAELEDLDINDSDGGSRRRVSIVVRVPEPDDLAELARGLCDIPEVLTCKVRGANGRRSTVAAGNGSAS
jgi:putative Mg2+ transporter-C (MgtC) family protein